MNHQWFFAWQKFLAEAAAKAKKDELTFHLVCFICSFPNLPAIVAVFYEINYISDLRRKKEGTQLRRETIAKQITAVGLNLKRPTRVSIYQ